MLMHVKTTNLAHTAGFNSKGLVFKYPDLPAPEPKSTKCCLKILLVQSFKVELARKIGHFCN